MTITQNYHMDVLANKVSQYMSSSVIKLNEQTRLPTATGIMSKKNKDEIIVIDENNNPVGIVTDEDILKRIGESHVHADRTNIEDIMHFPIIGIKHNETLRSALVMMRDNKIRKLVVYDDDDHIIGVIYYNTITNLISHRLAKPQKQSLLWGVIWNLGMVLQFAGVLMFIPGIVATILNDTVVATGIYLMSVLLLISGFFMNSYGEKQPLSLRGTAILVFSSFMALVLFGMIPHLFVIPLETASTFELLVDGFFESSAGFTTGGLSIVSNPEDLPRSFTLYRSYTQFVGGLSFIYLIVTAFYSETQINAMKGFLSGRTSRLKELFTTITIIFSIYVVIAAILLSYIGNGDIIDSFSLALSGVSTGGWIPDSHVFQDFTPPEYVILIIIMILGALPFSFHYAFVRTKFLSVNITREVIVYFGILAAFCTIFALSLDVLPLDSVFNLISGSTTTGYQTITLAKLAPTPFAILIIAMIIGGGGFSTAGGLKIFRLFQLVNLRHAFHKESWNAMSESNKKNVLVGIIILATSILIPLAVAYYMTSFGHNFQDAFFDGVSAITTTGLGAGTVDVSLDPFAKLVFGFLMILGRIEIILLVYMFIPKLM